MTDIPAPIVYRISSKMAEKLVSRLNENNIFVECIKSYIDTESLKTVAGVATATGISSVYVNEEREGKVAHHTLRYKNTYPNPNQPIYGNIVIVFGPKGYANLPDEMKTTDVNTIVL